MVFQENMYVRCPIIDREYPLDPRQFIMGQIEKVDDFTDTVSVVFNDPFKYREYYAEMPERQVYPKDAVNRCELFSGSKVLYGSRSATILKSVFNRDGYCDYYIQLNDTKKILRVKESELIAPFINGRVSPKIQLKKYEFQNPVWFLGRTIVNRSTRALENSIMGFKELAGCKIYLLPHQLNSIVRCVQEKPCRYMLADEVGMGKTIEAAAILKLYMNNNCNKNILIVVPEALKEQWRVELFLKFNIDVGLDSSGNNIELVSSDEVDDYYRKRYDFLVIDEVHKLLRNASLYESFHTISRLSENVLLLSATPLQKKTEEYLKLLRLLNPEKYDDYKNDDFSKLIDLQSKIINSIITILDDIEEYNELIEESEDDELDRDECEELFEDIVFALKKINKIIEDDTYISLVNKIDFSASDLGRQQMQIAVSYVCDNYQLERNIIRNRRNVLGSDEYSNQVKPIRHLFEKLSYKSNEQEYCTYQNLVELIEGDSSAQRCNIETIYKPLLMSFFSSASAFWDCLNKCGLEEKKYPDLFENAKKWQIYEEDVVEHINDLLDEGETIGNRFSTLIDYIDQNLFDKKILIFTNYSQTFDLYKQVLEKIYDSDNLSYFSKDMESNELELNVYRFQNDKNCRIMVSDETGGEGRNFQKADFVIHADLPWDANDIEQRIGRLDRLERDADRPDVNSVVIFSEETFEEQLFSFWNEGLNVFEESLCGLEIILEDINEQLYKAIIEDFRYGLYNAVPQIVESTQKLKKEIRREQLFDTISYLYKPINNELARLVRFYNKNDSELFATAMLDWAALAGFKPNRIGKNIVFFTANSFSLKSAENTLLIPPDWKNYVNKKENVFSRNINELYEKYKSIKSDQGSVIRGTFNRKEAINSDYLRFFAPGDDIYDCIIDNAIRSTRGQCAALAIKADFNWYGFIYTFSVEPNMSIMLDNNLTPDEVAYFRNFLCTDVAVVPVGHESCADISNDTVLRTFNECLENGYKAKRQLEHLGQRKKGKSGFMQIPLKYNISNLEWFKSQFPKDIWEESVDNTFEHAREIAKKEFSRKSNLKGAREEIQRLIAARAASNAYYGNSDRDIAALEKKYQQIFSCLKSPQINLEAACFIWMVNVN